MKRNTLMHLGLVACTAAFAACSESASLSLVSETEVSEDVAAVAGEAIAADVNTMIANESAANSGGAIPAPPSDGAVIFASPSDLTLDVTRSRTCYDDAGAAQTSCNATTTASITFELAMSGHIGFSHTNAHGSDSVDIRVHRARTWTVSGLLGTEVFRVHNGNGTSNDTTFIARTNGEVEFTRSLRLSATDTVTNVRFNLPRVTNPWPVSGTITRNISGTVEVTRGDQEENASFSRRVVVTFPADAQGNVAISVNGVNCTLNLVTHVVANCSTS